ncbi:hypothetical protein RJ45_23955 [Photobacterium gaetbulicola]|uniref:Uncharacterized protein n=1 Tax=Photobacterium gaetbulicola TaxID=1295392 RepID=A0A0B9GMF4_9GAMM|nr:hypothetical protein [Photobacterium gaetbulicola]KHT60061.1 hypothetical protein RJ45_23955 [Photobacterium gaetbulicola]
MIKITIALLKYCPEKFCDHVLFVAKKFEESACRTLESWGSMEKERTLVAGAIQGLFSIYNNNLS